MAVRKLSVALDQTVAASAARAAKAAGTSLSAWLSRAAQHELALERGRGAVREWEKEYGELTPRELERADAILDGLFGGRPKRV